MISKNQWPKYREIFPLHQKVFLDYISRLRVCVESYKNREVDAITCSEICRKILSEIDNPDFPFFAVRYFKELFSIILFQLPGNSSQRRDSILQPVDRRKADVGKMYKYDGIERRKQKGIEKS